MAFPGGRVDPGDVDAEAAAQRETLEEVGLDLAGAERLGQLDDRVAGPGRVGDLVLSSFVYHLPERPALVRNHEVRTTLWVPVAVLVAPDRRVEHPWPRASPVSRFPGILVGEPERHVVWGLTYRVVEDLLAVCGATVG
jgi:8-oxo-dGTP pyrophosphatase MutT (NUDIX family)